MVISREKSRRLLDIMLYSIFVPFEQNYLTAFARRRSCDFVCSREMITFYKLDDFRVECNATKWSCSQIFVVVEDLEDANSPYSVLFRIGSSAHDLLWLEGMIKDGKSWCAQTAVVAIPWVLENISFRLQWASCWSWISLAAPFLFRSKRTPLPLSICPDTHLLVML